MVRKDNRKAILDALNKCKLDQDLDTAGDALYLMATESEWHG